MYTFHLPIQKEKINNVWGFKFFLIEGTNAERKAERTLVAFRIVLEVIYNVSHDSYMTLSCCFSLPTCDKPAPVPSPTSELQTSMLEGVEN